MHSTITDIVIPSHLQYLSVDDDTDSENFLTPSEEENVLLLSENAPYDASESGNQRPRDKEGSQTAVKRKCPLKRSSSDVVLSARRLRNQESTTDSVRTAFRIDLSACNNRNEGTQPPLPTPALQAPPNSLRRSSSISGLGLRSRYHDPTIDSATLQQQLIKQTKHTGKRPLRPWRVRRARAATGPFQWSNPRSPRPGFKWFPTRSNSNPESIPQVGPEPKKRRQELPLRPCMKQKSKSAATTPPGELQRSTDILPDNRVLHRAKTVDFEEINPELLVSLSSILWSNRSVTEAPNALVPAKTPKPSPRKLLNRGSSCPGPTSKSSIAEPAVTKTDVHIVAIASSWSFDDTIDEGGIDPATPTTQIVESKSGCYEVIWNDVPAEHDIRLHRRSSYASQALNSIGSAATGGLERVNSRLTEWTWKGGLAPDSFKPQIVVFPDDEGYVSQFDCAVEDDEDFAILAPPNSELTSAAHSRHSSQPASRLVSRQPSLDESTPHVLPSPKLEPMVEELESHDKEVEKKEPGNSLVVPHLIVTESLSNTTRPGSQIGASRGVRKPGIPRRFSNIEESDIKFRGHKDSVTLTRSRIFNARGVSPELFIHRDSTSIAKKRMHAKNYAASAECEISQKAIASDPLSSINDQVPPVEPLPSPPTVKAHATRALTRSGSSSMLLPQPPAADRHIRIIQ